MRKILIILLSVIIVSCSASALQDIPKTEHICKTDIFGNDVYRISPDSDRGYNISPYLVIPEEIRSEHLIVYPFKSGKISSRYEVKEQQVLDSIVRDNYGSWQREVDNMTGAAALYLVIPEFSSEFRHLELDPWTLLSDDEFSHLDDQICKIIDDALLILEKDFNTELSRKVNMAGYSGEGNFIVRFALLHPDRLWIACAGGVSWSPSIALAEMKGEPLPYPLGIADIEKYTDDFDRGAWKDIRFLIDMGENDDRGSYNRQHLEKLNWAKEYAETENFFPIWNAFIEEYIHLSPSAEMITYHNAGHEAQFSPVIDFIKANDSESVPFIPINPTGSDIYVSVVLDQRLII